jgi:tRNA (guanine26-N2/guanine27-N2)-dimethyltransferase
MQVIVEGTAHMHYDPDETVFYNKVQVLNRDLSIQVIKLFSEKYIEEKLARLEKKKANKIARASEDPTLSTTTTFNYDESKANIEQGITILDALAASGLRSIRYLKEIPRVKHLTINDLSSTATTLAEENCQRNSVDLSKVIISNADATMLMYGHRLSDHRYDVIDLDPYGSAAPFLDAAVQAVAHGGLLCVTCTDMTALAGAFPEVCYAKYQSIPVKARYNHEMALRILLHAIDSAANKYKRHVIPWLSLSVDFYVRVFVRVYESAAEVKNSCLRRAMVCQSTQCPTFTIHPLATRKFSKQKANAGNCSECKQDSEERIVGGTYGATILRLPSDGDGDNMRIGGPFWSAPIHNQEVVDELLKRVENYIAAPKTEGEEESYPIPTAKRLGGILTSLSEELKDVPLYYSLPDLASTVQITVPTIAEFQAALASAGYRFSQFHHDPSAVKTDAPIHVVCVLYITIFFFREYLL